MAQGYSAEPQLNVPLLHPEMWKDPITGLWVPKRDIPNRAYREKLLTEAEDDLVLQQDLLGASSQSFLYWLNTFAWTYHQEDIDPETHAKLPAEIADWPFVTWPIQDMAAVRIEYCFRNGKDLLIKKSRDMGASWLCLSFLHWLWLFRPDTQIREMSRKEGLVDGDSDSLFWKHDYLNSWLPEWMLPPGVLIKGRDNRTKLHIENVNLKNMNAGEATTAVSLSGGRCAILFLDEFAKVDNGQQIRTATRDVTPCRLINSTPFGAGTEYARWKNSGKIEVFELMYWNHPEKGKQRYIQKDDLGRFHIRSPWFDIEDGIREPQAVAQEILAEDIESGETTFTISNVDKHIHLYARDPIVKLNIKMKDGVADAKVAKVIQRRDIKAVDFRPARNGKLLVWTNLVLGRPDQSKSYIFGIDTSKGQGASESVVSIKCKETGEKIARWSDANTPPYEFAKTTVALALWCGGCNPRKLPILKWEKNGPGWDLGRILVKKYCYPYYYTEEKVGTTGSGQVQKGEKKYGWQSSAQSKSELLGLYNEKLAHGGYINHDKKGLEQTRLYIHYPSGGCGPAELVFESRSARLLHGDIVIADALTLDDSKVPKSRHKGPVAPRGSFAWRKNRHLKKNKKSKGWRQKFDFGKGRI